MTMSGEDELKTIKRALISVYHKEPVRELVACLHALGVELVSTGGTFDFIASLGIPVLSVESLTGYPSILGGRVKTLHPLVFGGILARRDSDYDQEHSDKYGIPPIDLVVVDLYPFEKTVSGGYDHQEIIEKIDIGGISLIRAAAKNYQDVTVLASMEHVNLLISLLKNGNGSVSLAHRKRFAAQAFDISSAYDTAIYQYLHDGDQQSFKSHIAGAQTLRYGENPHQAGRYFGDLSAVFEQIQGKELSYNNLLDIDAAMGLISEFDEPAFAIIKHTNVCGLSVGSDRLQIWKDALAGDPVSAFGGILVTNRPVGEEVARAIHELFFEVLIAPDFDQESQQLFTVKKNRILLKSKQSHGNHARFRSALHGVLWQTEDNGTVPADQWTVVTKKLPGEQEVRDLALANIAVKHLKSNAIALVKNSRLLGMGAGQTSRVDALKQAIEKAKSFGHDLAGAVMASDAFFPFPDCVEIADKAGITAVIQPGGSVRDKESVVYCDAAGMSMAMTGRRHFRH
jgi:phosphoribosylaminoimidazolecarboxamide formyltransferase / IMP cyclohydrolase